jgi:aryl carrier-like protein
VILSTYDAGSLESIGVGAAWGKIAPGEHSDPHQHDETETFVIVSGHGDLIVDAKVTPVSGGTMVQFEPFETHYLHNSGPADLIFATFCWRDGAPTGLAEPGLTEPELLAWFSGVVREVLQLSADKPVADATLVSLGAESMQAIALQYQILARTDADVAVQDLLGDHTVAQLATLLASEVQA